MNLFRKLSLALVLTLCFFYGYSDFVKIDFKENEIPSIYLGPYFGENGSDFLLKKNIFVFKTSSGFNNYSFKIINVNNYYPKISKYDPRMRNYIAHTKRYVVILDKHKYKELAIFFWYIDRTKERETTLFYRSLYQSNSERELRKKYEKDKKNNSKEIFIKGKNGQWTGYYTKFLTD